VTRRPGGKASRPIRRALRVEQFAGMGHVLDHLAVRVARVLFVEATYGLPKTCGLTKATRLMPIWRHRPDTSEARRTGRWRDSVSIQGPNARSKKPRRLSMTRSAGISPAGSGGVSPPGKNSTSRTPGGTPGEPAAGTPALRGSWLDSRPDLEVFPAQEQDGLAQKTRTGQRVNSVRMFRGCRRARTGA